MKCPNCNEKLHFFKKKRLCQACNKEYCKNCSLEDPNEIEKLSSKGWCWTCYLNTQQVPQQPRRTDSEVKTNQVYQELTSLSQLKTSNPFEIYEVINCIGQGGSGIVYKVQQKHTKKFFALKEINMIIKPEKNIRREFLFGYSHKSNNLVKSLEIYKYEDVYYIVQELMAIQLSRFLQIVSGELSENKIFYILQEILKGLTHLHSMNYIHRDLKSDNIFINTEGDIKIGDFGEVEELTSEISIRDTIIGTPYWIAPEVCNNKPYGQMIDIWSFGIIVYEIVEKQIPYKKMPISDLFNKIVNEEPPKLKAHRSEGLKSIALACLQKNPFFRMNPRELLGLKCMMENKENCREFIVNIIKRF